MIDKDQIQNFREVISLAKSVFVIIGHETNVDQLASAASLVLGLKNLGKEVEFFTPRKWQDKTYEKIIGVDQIKTDLGKQNLVISFPYQEQAVDKVSYHIGTETKRFYLTIKPKKGVKPLDFNQVEFAYAGAQTDLVILVGIHDLNTLEHLYFGYEQFFSEANVAVIHNFKPELGNIKLDVSGYSSMSEALLNVLTELQIKINSDIASNLLLGIEETTRGLSSLAATAETFEVVAKLLRAGARRYKEPVVKNEASKTPSNANPSPTATAVSSITPTTKPMSFIPPKPGSSKSNVFKTDKKTQAMAQKTNQQIVNQPKPTEASKSTFKLTSKVKPPKFFRPTGFAK